VLDNQDNRIDLRHEIRGGGRIRCAKFIADDSLQR
jgi:hypothetical protein